MQHMFNVLDVMHRSCAFAAPSERITLFDVKAAFPSACWDWLRSAVNRLGMSSWLITGLRALYSGSVAMVMFNSVAPPNSPPSSGG